ncbi:DNA polymerase I [Alphaproteobacteria bacterium]|jgi:DNA polymerase-1|nr:DNA polymerase I [Alphaproteobacteria bacterium]MDA9765450.1 DNA polymerase I [Alphaproteobacteria bacterium]
MTEASAPEQLVLIDGSGYIFRAFHALPMMMSPEGVPVNAVFGFTKMLMKLMDDLQPSHVLVIFDAGRVTFRNDIYPEYKQNRTDPPDELVPQFSLVRDATEAMSLPVTELPGFEADDLIASYAKMAHESGTDCLIVSSDKDLMQLVRPGVTMLDPMKQRRISDAEVVEKFGVLPNRVVDVQSLAGDSTDNVPGVPGIGIKTAAELINQFGDLDSLLAGAETIKQPKRRENLVNFAEQARISRELVRLKDDVPLDNNIASLVRPHRDMDRLSAFLSGQGFNSLLASIGAKNAASQKTAPTSGKPDSASPFGAILPPHVEAPSYELVTTTDALSRWIDEARSQGFIAIDTETTSLNASSASLVGVALATAPGKACYIPLRHVAPASEGAAQGGLDFAGDAEVAETVMLEQMDEAEALSLLRGLCADPSILKIGHNLKYDAHVLSLEQNGGLSLTPVDDTMCLSYVLDAGRTERHGLDYLALSLLDIQTIKYQDVCGKGAKQISFAEVSPEAACTYASEDADITLRLWTMLKPRLAREGMSSVYERLERPLIPILAHMEAAGIKVDTQLLHGLSQDFAGRIQILEGEIHQLAGETFNIASPKQLGEILFEKLGYEGGKKSKTGAFSTGADILEDMAENGVEIARKVLDYRQLAKLKSTYTDALMASVNNRTGRVHTSFSMVGASTGRLSSSDPNLQNIPIRTQEGRQIRGAFIARPGCKLISADYSQIELRLVAHVAQEKTMLEAFRNGVDIHAQTASEVFGVPLDQMDAETRRRSKAINFGIVYGISAFGLSRQLSIPQSEARDYIATYLDRFPGIRTYMNDAREFAREHLYVETLFGRRIHIEQIGASNQAMRGFSERQAINAPIQGSAADIIKRAMICLPAELAAQGLAADMLLQVHDELIFEVPEEQAEQSVQLIKSVMENAASPVVQLSVPLVVDAGIADSWSEAH